MARSNMKIANATKIQREIEVIQRLTSGMFSKNLDKLSMRGLPLSISELNIIESFT